MQKDDDPHDPDPKAIARYGMLRLDTQAMMLHFVDGRPVSHVTTQLLAWWCERLFAEHKQTLVVVWDHASWPLSHKVSEGP